MDQRRRRKIAVTALAVCLLSGLTPAFAQTFSAQQLLRYGDQYYGANCVTGSKYYFALTQKFPELLSASDRSRLTALIAKCEANANGAPGLSGKFDSAKEQSCRAYAEITGTEARMAASISACHPGGPRWSTDLKFHYDWCMASGVKMEQVRAEHDARRKFLDGCAFG